MKRVVPIAFAVSLGGFLFGFDASVISGVVSFIRDKFSLNDWQLGWVVGAPTLGGVFAALIMGPLSDLIGRKKTLIIIASLYTVSAIFSAFAPNYQILAIARFIGGLAFGSLMIAPIYIAEISPSGARGRLVSINQLNIVIGFSAAYFANYAILQLSKSDASWVSALRIDTETWRWMLGLEFLPAVAYVLLLFRIPESPRWLASNGHIERARKVFNGLGISPSNTATEAASPQSRLNLIERLKGLTKPEIPSILLIGLIVGIAQQVTGINAVYFYAPSIFEQSGVGTDAAFSQAIWIGITNVVFTLISMATIDILGRKPLMVIGLVGAATSLAITSFGFYQADYQLSKPDLAAVIKQNNDLEWQHENLVFPDDVAFKNTLSEVLGEELAKKHESELIKAAININATLVLIGILGFVASFAVSLGPVMWVVLSEVFPGSIRGFAMAVIGMFNSGASFLVQLVFPWELSKFGAAGVFAGYAVAALLSLIFVFIFLPETKSKSLEELEEELT